MGLFSDTLEDNRERAGQRFSPIDSYGQDEEPAVREHRCPVCYENHATDTGLQDHIFRRHGGEHAYLRVNGRVIWDGDVAFFSDGIQTCEIVLLGFEKAAAWVRQADTAKDIELEPGENSLTAYLSPQAAGEVEVSVTPPHGHPRLFSIYSLEIEDFDSEELDLRIVSLQEKLESESSDLSHWNELLVGNESHGKLAQRYLNGFLEYSIGLYQEREHDWQDATDHLERAYQLLAPFTSPLARAARMVLGMKLNSFSILGRAPGTTMFAGANAFFNEPLGSSPTLPGPGSVAALRSATGLYIDDFTVGLLEGIEQYYEGLFEELARRIVSLRQLTLSMERNNADKLRLLTARSLRAEKRLRQAYDAYEPLARHPQFGSEAQDFIDPHEADAAGVLTDIQIEEIEACLGVLDGSVSGSDWEAAAQLRSLFENLEQQLKPRARASKTSD
jgi:hypothetical protein